MKQEQGLTRQKAIAELVRSPHGELEKYLEVGTSVASSDPEFFAHLIAWNAKKGEVRDSKCALPIIAMGSQVSLGEKQDKELLENALAHLALLAPRDLMRARQFSKEHKVSGRRQRMARLLKAYLSNLENNRGRWERACVQHRRTLKNMYSLGRIKPGDYAKSILFDGKRPPGSVFDKIARLREMDPLEAAGFVVSNRIPFLVAAPALGKKLQDKSVLAALIDRMTPNELTVHMKMLERMGVKKDPVLRGALEKALVKLQDGRSNNLKLSQATATLEDDDFRERVQAVQEKKLDKSSVDGNWLIIADKSSSMRQCIEVGQHIAGVLARMVSGKVSLVFVDSMPTYFDVSGETLDEVKQITSRVQASGWTSLGCGLRWAIERGIDVDGIAVVSDGGENYAPFFCEQYKSLCRKLDKDLPVYYYQLSGDVDNLTRNCQAAQVDLHTFDLRFNLDYYSLPNLVQTMRTNRYSLIDEVMETPLLTLDKVLKNQAVAAI